MEDRDLTTAEFWTSIIPTLFSPYKMGGYLTGPSHEQGGIRNIEVEGGEYIVRKSSVDKIGKKNLDYLNETGEIPTLAYNGGGLVTKALKEIWRLLGRGRVLSASEVNNSRSALLHHEPISKGRYTFRARSGSTDYDPELPVNTFAQESAQTKRYAEEFENFEGVVIGRRGKDSIDKPASTYDLEEIGIRMGYHMRNFEPMKIPQDIILL